MNISNRVLAGFILIIALAGLIGCQADNPPLTGPPKLPEAPVEHQVVEKTSNGVTINYDTRLDILFIIDDSRSMRSHQANLSRNILSFVKQFASIKAIDLHRCGAFYALIFLAQFPPGFIVVGRFGLA